MGSCEPHAWLSSAIGPTGGPLKRSRGPGGVAPANPLSDTPERASPRPAAQTFLRPGWPTGRRRPDRVSIGPPAGVRGTAGGPPGGGRGIPRRRKRSGRPLPPRPHPPQPHDVRGARAPLRVPDLWAAYLCERGLRGARAGRRGVASRGRATRGPGYDATASPAGAGGRPAARDTRTRSTGPGARTRARGRRPESTPRAAHAPSAGGRRSRRTDPAGSAGRDQPGPGAALPLLRGRQPLGLGFSGRGSPATADQTSSSSVCRGYDRAGPGARIASTTSRAWLSLRMPCGTPAGATSIIPVSIASSRPSSRKTPLPSSTW